MSTEINTRGTVRSKVLGFPSGNDAECLSKSEITATGRALVNGSYGDNECPVIEDVVKAEIHPLQSEITIKRGTADIINLSGYISEILLVKLYTNGIEVNQNRIITVGETLLLIIVSCVFTGNAIEFHAPIQAPPATNVRLLFNIDGREYKITVTTI